MDVTIWGPCGKGRGPARKAKSESAWKAHYSILWNQGLRKKEVFQCKWKYENRQGKVKTQPSKEINVAPIIQEQNLLLGAGQGDNTCTVFPVFISPDSLAL